MFIMIVFALFFIPHAKRFGIVESTIFIQLNKNNEDENKKKKTATARTFLLAYEIRNKKLCHVCDLEIAPLSESDAFCKSKTQLSGSLASDRAHPTYGRIFKCCFFLILFLLILASEFRQFFSHSICFCHTFFFLIFMVMKKRELI